MPVLRSCLGLVGILALAGLSAPARAQPVGSEFQVNTYTFGSQRPKSGNAIAADANGNFVVVWQSAAQAGDGYWDAFGQRFDGAGAPLGAEFRVNAFTSGHQMWPAVAAAAGGDFVVVWHGVRQDGSRISGQRYDSGGMPQGDEFRVNSYSRAGQSYAAVASDASGNFVVVWQSFDQDGDRGGIFGQRYDSAGARLGGEFRVNSYTTSHQHSPSVAADASGNFVVVWESYNQNGFYNGIVGQRYDGEGQPLGGEFQVGPGVGQTEPQVASDAAGNFVVVWAFYQLGFPTTGLFGQRYDSAGVPQGGEFRVNTSKLGFEDALFHDVASSADGNFVVVWDESDGSSFGVYGRAFNSAGVPQSEQFQINTYTTGYQRHASVAAKGPNEFVVAWRSDGQDGSYAGVFGRHVLNPAGQAGGRVEDQRTRTQSSAGAAKRWTRISGRP